MSVKEILIADNFPENNIVEVTQLASSAAASQADLTVENVQGYAEDDFLLIGNPGSPRAELKQILSIDDQIITLTSDLALDHSTDELITKLRGNQINFYRAANVDGTVPDDGDFTLVSTVSIEPDQTETEYVDSVGGTGYWYKFTINNSATSEETDLASAQAVRGGGYNVYASVGQVRTTAGLKNNPYITDAQVLEAIEDAEGQVKASLSAGGYTLPLAEVPLMVRYITKQLAAGHLLTDSHGAQHTGTTVDGDAKIKRATDLLAKIESGKLHLVIASDDSIVSSGTVTVAGYPDDTAEDRYPSEAPKFRMSDEY